MFWLILFIIWFVFLSSQSYAKDQFWPYGDKKGISISPSGVVTEVGSSIYTGEGCASVQNSVGETLFYTDGDYVYNSSGTKINSIKLFGDDFYPRSSTQGSIIIPLGDCKRFLEVCTPGVEGPNSPTSPTAKGLGVAYVTVDESKNVTINNTSATKVLTNLTFCEKICAFGSQNSNWIVARELAPGSSKYLKWNLNEAQMNGTNSITDAVSFFQSSQQIQNVGRPLSNTFSMNTPYRYYHAQGQMKFSSDGTKFGQVFVTDKVVEIMDFNSATGTMSNSRVFPLSQVDIYGFEFSSSGKNFYVTEHYRGSGAKNRILKFTYTNSIINNPSVLFTADNYKDYAFAGMELALDGNIYVQGTYFNHIRKDVTE